MGSGQSHMHMRLHAYMYTAFFAETYSIFSSVNFSAALALTSRTAALACSAFAWTDFNWFVDK